MIFEIMPEVAVFRYYGIQFSHMLVMVGLLLLHELEMDSLAVFRSTLPDHIVEQKLSQEGKERHIMYNIADSIKVVFKQCHGGRIQDRSHNHNQVVRIWIRRSNIGPVVN